MAGPTFRTIFKFLVPSWLSSGDGGLVLQSLMQVVDDYSQRAREALELRMPTRVADDALAELGADRSIPRGRNETSANYAQRLLGWRWPRGHRTRGSAFALLAQISAYFGGIVGITRDVNGGYYTRAADGTESVSLFNTWNWDNTLPAPNWGRFWVEVSGAVNYTFTAQLNFGDPLLYGGALGTFGYCVGLQGVIGRFGDPAGVVGILPSDFDAIRALFTSRTPWKPAGTRAEWLIINLDGVPPAPDGHYLHWSKVVASVQVPSRYSGHRYVALYPGNSAYAGNPNSYCTSFTLAGGGTYAGSATSYPATITLPNGGGTYAGNPNNWPATITLKDDGSDTQ